MKRPIGLALLAAALAACEAAGSNPTEKKAATTRTVPEPLRGCWENVSADGVREWLEIDAASVRGQFVGDPVFQTSEIGPGMEAGNEGLVIMKITMPAPDNKARVSHELWMDETDSLRVSNYWGAEEAEPDPEFSRCSTANDGKPSSTR